MNDGVVGVEGLVGGTFFFSFYWFGKDLSKIEFPQMGVNTALLSLRRTWTREQKEVGITTSQIRSRWEGLSQWETWEHLLILNICF